MSSDYIKRAAVLRIESDFMRDLLQLPEGVEVVAVGMPIGQDGVIDIKVRGIGWPVADGDHLQFAAGCVTRTFNDRGEELLRRINWGLPE